jgi:hypothetical protein
MVSGWPGWVIVGAAGPAANTARTPAAVNRRKLVARSSAARRAGWPCAAARATMAASSVASRGVPAAAAARRNRSATGPSARKACSVWLRGRTALAGLPPLARGPP